MSIEQYKTVSGIPLNIGTGTGTKWQWAKKANKDAEIHQDLVDQLVLAIKLGYTHIDTAEIYTTSPEVAAAVEQSGKKREDLWITNKYTPGFPQANHPADSDGPLAALDKLLKELKTDYIDLYLIHSPFFDDVLSKGQTIASAWAEMIAAKKSGKVRYIGVSNFAIPHLEETFKVAGGDKEYYPKFNQVEAHAYLPNQSKDIVQFSHDNGIVVEAYGPLTPLFRIKDGDKVVTDHPLTVLLPELAKKYGKTDAQILLRYTLQSGILPITTSSKADRIKESLEIYNFKLDDADVAKIDAEGAKFKFRGFFGAAFDDFE